MVFKTLHTLDASFKAVRLIALVAIGGSVLFSIFIWSSARNMVAKEREKIYVLDKGKSLILALQEDLAQNFPAEVRDHVKTFHELFFTMSPDDEVVKYNMKRALFLADESAYRYYKDLAESGYYRELISTNTRQYIKVDSLECNFDSYPYAVRTYAQQIIVRPSVRVVRTLITDCKVTRVSRSDNNSHGLLIEQFNIINNGTISTQKRQQRY
jgi:conjugative transposon TraK protein